MADNRKRQTLVYSAEVRAENPRALAADLAEADEQTPPPLPPNVEASVRASAMTIVIARENASTEREIKDAQETEKKVDNLLKKITPQGVEVWRRGICPFCGRRLSIPPWHGPVKFACKECGNIFRYDPETGVISLSFDHLVKTRMTRGQKRVAAFAIIIAILLGGLGIAYILHKPDVVEKSTPAASEESLDDIRRELKSLSE